MRTRSLRDSGDLAPSATRCIVCASTDVSDVIWWAARCATCGTWTSSLQPAINEQTPEEIDDEARIAGLRELRRQNFRVVLDRIETTHRLAGKRLLDVGCAYGWFLQDAAERGADALGIEPDEAIAAYAQDRGLQVRSGWFPDALADDERFDVITFNDVMEHIPDVPAALGACFAHLAPGGLLSVNIPTSDGLGYRASTRLAKLGIRGPYARFWQAGLPSPHTYYFPRSALRRVVEKAGFECRGVLPLTAVTSKGLWQRVHMFRKPSPASVGGYVGVQLLAPILNLPSASDIAHVVAVRP
jgi:2-polyprenyl-3-methyl-5-hydroxy-6-metoxy-1,4-benzoquinol methylase